MAVHQRKSSSKKKSGESKSVTSNAEDSTQNEDEGSQTFKIPWKRILARLVLCALLIFVVYFSTHKSDDPHVFARQKETLEFKSVEVPCSKEYLKDISKFKGCVPQSCGRLVTDIVVTPQESAHLLRLCKKGLAFGGSSGGASILDLHSGALSHGNTFINIYEKLKAEKNNIFSSTDFKVYSNVRDKIQKAIAYRFGLQMNKLYLTHPTFFSEMTSKPAMTKHDEYWHLHIDKETYPSFHYTSLLYLNNYGEDFTGGRFVFVDPTANVTVEPKMGRVSAFTSGAENPHHVEQVTSGTRYAITVSFTCDPKQAIADPTNPSSPA